MQYVYTSVISDLQHPLCWGIIILLSERESVPTSCTDISDACYSYVVKAVREEGPHKNVLMNFF